MILCVSHSQPVLTSVDIVDDGVGCAAALALRHVNARNGSVVPALSTLDPSFRLRALFYDTESVPQGGVPVYFAGRSQGANAVIGAYRSAVSIPIALLAGIDRVPQISYGSSSPVFTDKATYPFFTRTYPNDDLSAQLLVGLLLSFGWRNVAVLHVNDAYGSGYAAAMRDAAQAMDLIIRVRVVSIDYASDGAGGMNKAVAQVKASGDTIIVTVVRRSDSNARTLCSTSDSTRPPVPNRKPAPLSFSP